MSKQGSNRRTSEQRIARRQQRTAAGSGTFRYLTPQQIASGEFDDGSEVITGDLSTQKDDGMTAEERAEIIKRIAERA